MVTKQPKPIFDTDDSSELEEEIEVILGTRADLVPSVRKIIESGEPKPVAKRALQLLAAALADPTTPDPNRNPAVALDAARAEVGGAG
jgi:hypothetical protein